MGQSHRRRDPVDGLLELEELLDDELDDELLEEELDDDPGPGWVDEDDDELLDEELLDATEGISPRVAASVRPVTGMTWTASNGLEGDKNVM